MKKVFFGNSLLAYRVAHRPASYLSELEPFIIGKTAKGIWIDADRQGWKPLKAKYADVRAHERKEAHERRDKLTRALWTDLHAQPFKPGGLTLEWLAAFEKRVPCGDCIAHWRKIVAANPLPANATPQQKYLWTVDRHNDVNKLLNKPQWTPTAVR